MKREDIAQPAVEFDGREGRAGGDVDEPGGNAEQFPEALKRAGDHPGCRRRPFHDGEPVALQIDDHGLGDPGSQPLVVCGAADIRKRRHRHRGAGGHALKHRLLRLDSAGRERHEGEKQHRQARLS